MKKATLILMLVALLGVALTPSDASVDAQDDAPPATVVDVLSGDADDRFSTLLAAAQASGLSSLLATDGPYTLLAPTDDAFAAFLADLNTTPDALLADAALLQRVLAYHILPGRITAAQVAELDDQTLATSLGGASIAVSVREGVPQLNGNAPSSVDLMAGNGVVHVIDAVLMPPAGTGSTDTLFAVALADTPSMFSAIEARATDPANPEFTLAYRAITFAGYEDILSQPGNYTLLVPTDAAMLRYFARVESDPESAFSGDPSNVIALLSYSIMPAAYTTDDLLALESGFVGTALDGRLLSFSLNNDLPTFNGLSVVGSETVTANGAVFGIDGLLFSFLQTADGGPNDDGDIAATDVLRETATLGSTGEATLMATLQADPDYRTLVMLIEAADLAALLAENGPYTLLAPTNAALDSFLAAQGLTSDDLINDYNLLARVLLYHIVPGRLDAAALGGLAGESIATALPGQLVLLDEGPTFNTVSVAAADLQASNGIIHGLDGVLMPAGGDLGALLVPADDTIAEWLAAAENYTIFAAAVDAAGLGEVMANAGPYTVLAPTDDALTAFLAQRGLSRLEFLNNAALLQTVVFYHVIPYRYAPEQLTADLGLYGTLSGETVGMSRDPESAIILMNDAQVTDDPALLSNGVVYPINDVLVPN